MRCSDRDEPDVIAADVGDAPMDAPGAINSDRVVRIELQGRRAHRNAGMTSCEKAASASQS